MSVFGDPITHIRVEVTRGGVVHTTDLYGTDDEPIVGSLDWEDESERSTRDGFTVEEHPTGRARIHLSARGSVRPAVRVDDCGVCDLTPTVTGYVRGVQVSCPVHGEAKLR